MPLPIYYVGTSAEVEHHARPLFDAFAVRIPRFDALLGRMPRVRQIGQPFTILVATAKCPGFDRAQLKTTAQSLIDLKQWLARNPRINGVAVRAIWRITQGLENDVAVA